MGTKMRFKCVPAFAIALAAIAQPALAFGPAGMGRDLMYTASIAPTVSSTKVVRAGFIRPNLPTVLADTDNAGKNGLSITTLSQPLGIVVNFVFDNLLAETVGALSAGVEINAFR